MYNTNKLSDDILSIASDLVGKHVNEAYANFYDFSDKWGDYVHENLFAPVLATFKCSAKKLTYVEIRSVAGVGKINSSYETSFRVNFTESLPVPDFISPEFLHLGKQTNAGLVLCDHPVWHEMRDELVVYNNEYKNALVLYDDFMDFIDDVIAQYSTVDEAIAAWPAFRFLLPENLQTKDFRFDGTPKALPKDADVAGFTAMIVRAKLEV